MRKHITGPIIALYTLAAFISPTESLENTSNVSLLLCSPNFENNSLNLSVAEATFYGCVFSSACRRLFGLSIDATYTDSQHKLLSIEALLANHGVPTDMWQTSVPRALHISDLGGGDNILNLAMQHFLCSDDSKFSNMASTAQAIQVMSWSLLLTERIESARFAIDSDLPMCADQAELPRCGAGQFIQHNSAGSFQCACHRQVQGSHYASNADEVCGNREKDASSGAIMFALVCVVVFESLVLATQLSGVQVH